MATCKPPTCDTLAETFKVAMLACQHGRHVTFAKRPDGKQVIHVRVNKTNELVAVAIENSRGQLEQVLRPVPR